MLQDLDPPSASLPDPLLRLPNTFRPFYGAFAGLRPIQIEAIAPILWGRDLIVQAATGSGKSEAVLAPSLERVITSGRAHGVLYIIPTRALAKDLAPVRVNVISPGMTAGTGAYLKIPETVREEMFASIAQRLPVGRVGRPEDIAEAALMLMTNGFITGVVLDVDGGGLIA